MPFGGGGGGGGMGGGGYSGGPLIVPASDILVQSLSEDQLFQDLFAQDVASLGTTATPTATAIIANFDGNASGNGLPAIDLNDLFSSSSLATLSSLYEQAITGQAMTMDEYFDYMNSVSSMEWAAWHSGPTSDILNFIDAQQQALQISFQEFAASRLETQYGQQIAAKGQQESIAISYLVDRGGELMNANPGMSFLDALNLVAAAVKANPSDLIAYATGLTQKIETVIVTASADPYGSDVPASIIYVTDDGNSGVASDGGPPRPNADMTQVNAQALAIKYEILGHSDYLTTEYIALIYKDLDGVIKHTNLVIGGEEQVTGSFVLPLGATVVGWVHNHPDIPFVNGAVPSPFKLPDGNPGDWSHVQDMIKEPHVDPALVTYILDDGSQKLYGYGIEHIGDSLHLGDFIG